MLAEFEQQISSTLEEIKSQGLYKTERIITTPQDAHIAVADGKRVLNMCANKDSVISDELNHASIIDGIRLCKAQRFRYKHNDMADLEAQLRAAQNARFRLVATDGCFSMDGTIANLKGIVDLAEKYDALTMID